MAFQLISNKGKYHEQKTGKFLSKKSASKGSKTTTQALLTSTISLTLSMVLMMGTTLAWYTSNVSSGVQVIKAGTMGAKVTYQDGNETRSIQDADIFGAGATLAPGKSLTKTVCVENTGDLNFSYNLLLIAKDADGEDNKGATEYLNCYLTREKTAAPMPYGVYLLKHSNDQTVLKQGETHEYTLHVEYDENRATDAKAVKLQLVLTANQLTPEGNFSYTPAPVGASVLKNSIAVTAAEAEKQSEWNYYLDKDLNGDLTIDAGNATVHIYGQGHAIKGQLTFKGEKVVLHNTTVEHGTQPVIVQGLKNLVLNKCVIQATDPSEGIGITIAAAEGNVVKPKILLNGSTVNAVHAFGAANGADITVKNGTIQLVNEAEDGSLVTIAETTYAANAQTPKVTIDLVGTNVYTTTTNQEQWYDDRATVTSDSSVFNGEPID